MRRFAATALLLLLLVPASMPSGGQGASGEAPLLRLYGCSDDLDTTDPETAQIGPDGVPDCSGDRLRFPAAWLSGASDPALRAALPTHDQRIDLTLVYHPSYWAPSPGAASDATAVMAQPGAPGEGLFDLTPTGSFDPSFHSDEDIDPNLDDNDVADRVDIAPHDGLADRAARNDGRAPDADLYFPALETRFDLTWFRDTPDPEPLPDRGSLLFPGVLPLPGTDRPDAWVSGERPARTQWYATPLGIGTTNDGIGALVTASLTLAPGDSVRFLDHTVRLDGFVDDQGRRAASLDVSFAGRTAPRVIGSGFLVDIDPDGQRPATVGDAGATARNVLFADTREVTRTVPIPAAGDPADDDDAWFVILDRFDDAADPTEATLRIGRLVSSAAPLNAVLSDGGLYRVEALQERNGALAMFGWSRIVPLEESFRFRSLGVDVAGVAADQRIPLLPPFDRDHVHLEDIRPDLERDVYGFLQETPASDGIVSTGQLLLSRGADSPEDRARRTPPLDLYWTDRANEVRLGAGHAVDDGTVQRGLVVPFRQLTLRMPAVPVVVHSVLFDDTDLIQHATEAPDTPRAARSFVFDPEDPPQFYLDRGLRLYGGTPADPNTADVLRLASGVIRPSEHIGQTRLPSALAAQRTDVDIRYQPYFIHERTGRGLLPISDESIDRDIDVDADSHIIDVGRGGRGDNLYDVAPRNHDPQLADIYGPVVEVRYTGRLLDPGSFLPIDAPFDSNTRIHVPAADRDANKPGLDSADLNGDGNDEGVALAGYWDRDASGGVAEHWKTSGTFDPGRDLVWLQSPLLDVPLGGDVRFFDHGVTYVQYDGPTRGTGTLQLTDLQDASNGTSAPVLVTAPNVAPERGDCLGVRRDGAAWGNVVPCKDRTAAQLTPPFAIGTDSDKWWVEIVELGAASASVRMHRVFAPAGSDTFWVGGAAYEWTEWVPGATRGIANWGLEVRVPLGSDVFLAPGAPAETLPAVPASGRVPFLPPFDARHLVLAQNDVAATRDVYGVDSSEPRAAAVSRVRWVDPLFAQVESWDQERAHRFVHVDATRWLDPGRTPGHAFVGGTFAVPWHGIVGTNPWLAHAPDALRESGRNGFDEALRSAGDRGWDHFVALDIPFDQGPYRLDSARLGAPSRVVSPGGPDPWTEGRSSAYLLHAPARAADIYTRTSTSGAPPPVGVGPEPPAAVPDDGPRNGGKSEDGPGLGFAIFIGAVAVGAALVRGRRT